MLGLRRDLLLGQQKVDVPHDREVQSMWPECKNRKVAPGKP
jgi:hypothetical protein